MKTKLNFQLFNRKSLLKSGGLAFHSGVLIAALLFLPGCKDETRQSQIGDAGGSYALVSVDGKKVPASISHDGTPIQVRSGKFTINADGTCASETVFVPPGGATVQRKVKASYTKQGSKLTMQWEGAGTTTGNIEGNTFTMNNEGMLLVYRK